MMETVQDNKRAAAVDPEADVSPLEHKVLEEYAKLVGNLDTLSSLLADMADNASPEILDSLRLLERKTSTVFTLLKASVYSIVLQQEIYGGDQKLGGASGS